MKDQFSAIPNSPKVSALGILRDAAMLVLFIAALLIWLVAASDPPSYLSQAVSPTVLETGHSNSEGAGLTRQPSVSKIVRGAPPVIVSANNHLTDKFTEAGK